MIDNTEQALVSLQLKYTNRHPEVRRLKSLLIDYNAMKAAEMREREEKLKEVNEKRRAGEAIENVGDLSGLANSPVYLDMKKLLTESKAKVAALNARVKDYEEVVADLEQRVNTIPQIEGQLKQLERDYGVIKTQHSALLKRRETARMGQDIEQKASDVTFRVIDPPYVPLKPSEPNKVMLNGIVLLAGLVVGMGVSFLVALINPVFFDSRTLSSVTGLPVLGSVTITLQPEEKRRERFGLAAFASLVVCLVLSYVGLTFGTGLLELM